jgi:hypothetical protein
LIGGYFNNENPKNTQDLDFLQSTEPFKVDYTGTGFLLFWKDLCPDKFNSYYKGIQAHDWAWSFALKNSGKDLWMIPNAICKHYNDIDNYILPPKDISKDNIIPAYTYTKITKNAEEKIENVVIRKPKWINKK